jgi:hypothetical protein
MQVPASVKPAAWGAVGGAIVMMIVGFWGFNWSTAGTAEKMSQQRADAAVVAALVPFCLAKAEQDTDRTKLVKARAESSSYSRRQLVVDAGWATLNGAKSADSALASACSDKLEGLKSS